MGERGAGNMAVAPAIAEFTEAMNWASVCV